MSLRALLPALTALVCLAQPQIAAAQGADALTEARLLPGWRTETGTRMAAVSLVLAPGWKTYWRAPGEAGIPPSFDWSGSQNLGSVTIHWPRPEVFEVNGLHSIGYHDRLVLPVEITPRDPAQPVLLQGSMMLGVCSDICVPATVALSGDLAGEGAPDAAISAALRARPLGAAAGGVLEVACSVRPLADGLNLTASIVLPDQGGPETVVIEPPDPTIWVAPTSTVRDGHTITASADLVPAASQPFVLDRSGVTLTVLGRTGAVEIKGCPAAQ